VSVVGIVLNRFAIVWRLTLKFIAGSWNYAIPEQIRIAWLLRLVWPTVAPSFALPTMIWQTRTRRFDLREHSLIMGVLNVTPDSFSDGGAFIDHEQAVMHGLAMAKAGAQIIDVGGESTRPGAQPVALAEEMRRVLPVVERLAGDPGFVVSIDTMKPDVARAAVAHGAEIINDVTGLRDGAMREVVAATGAAAVVMHMQGNPRDMQVAPRYEDVCGEIREFFRQVFHACLRCGIDIMRLAFDPGIGFGKTAAHNLTLLRHLDSLRVDERPLVLGASRKSFIGKVLDDSSFEARSWPTVALTSYARTRGANVLRVHEVGPNLQALRMTEAILHP
jgi:dihydropteroate synthase